MKPLHLSLICACALGVGGCDAVAEAADWALDGIFGNVRDSYEDQVAQGAAVYAEECVSCHGETSAGTPWGGNLRKKLQTMTFHEFSRDVLNGQVSPEKPAVMPAFADVPRVRNNVLELYHFLNQKAWPPEEA